MPYIETKRVAEIRDQIKKEFPDFKFSVTREGGSSVYIKILAGPLQLLTDEKAIESGRESVNHFYIEDHYKDHPEVCKMLSRIYEVANQGNRVLTEDGDYGSVPLFYVNMEIGTYDKKYELTEVKPVNGSANLEKIEVTAGEVNIIDYSEKAIAVIGDTKPIKDKLKELGGKFNFRLSCGPGWIFPKSKLETIQNALTA